MLPDLRLVKKRRCAQEKRTALEINDADFDSWWIRDLARARTPCKACKLSDKENEGAEYREFSKRPCPKGQKQVDLKHDQATITNKRLGKHTHNAVVQG